MTSDAFAGVCRTAADDPEVIGPEGIEQFCSALAVDPEDVVMLVLAWKMDAKQMVSASYVTSRR